MGEHHVRNVGVEGSNPFCSTFFLPAVRILVELSRSDIDRVARAVVSGERGLGAGLDALADRGARVLRSRLAAVGAAGRRRGGHRPAEHPAANDVIRRILERVDQHLAIVAFANGEAIDARN